MAKKYIWTAKSDDGCFDIKSNTTFDNKEECYNDMRNHALNKMKWNTEYAEDFNDMMEDEYIGYSVKFYQNKIVHESYSGVYTYQIEEVINLPQIPNVAEVRNHDFYDNNKHCWCIDVDEDDVKGIVAARVYDNGFVEILNRTLCANPMVFQSINEILQEILLNNL